MLRRVILTATLSLCFAGGVAAADCPEVDQGAVRWMDKMSRSFQEVSYQGVVMLQRGSEMRVLQVTHTVDGGASTEVLTELTGKGAKVERLDHPLDCIHPGIKRLRSGPVDHCGLAAQYRFSVSEGERVAGRSAVRITVEPRDMYRFGYVMTLDRETGLLLKLQTRNQGQQVLETMQFAHLSYTDPVPATTEVEVVHRAQHPEPNVPATRNAVGRPWKVGWLPRGFTPTDSTLGTDGRRTYTDGLAVLSIFLEDLDKEIRAGEGRVKMGGTTTYTRGRQLAGRSVLVTVIGEVPLNTARMVADSVHWVQ